ncbi:MAG TPA: uroporphyrinogen decarboxylase [Terriglobales bacterium]|nr:uroporphyrinogen decarboxylase [Terriglobales bacterium]
MTPKQRFDAACRHQPVDRPPVWLMRQAGRYMAEYRAVRARHSLLEICRTPALAAAVTITAAERLGVDAAIIFADLLLPAEPLGLKLEFLAGEGPKLEPALRTPAQIAALPETWGGRLGYVSEAIALVHRHFEGRLPVLGFAGAPFTLASYLIEGGGSRHYAATKGLMYSQPDAWDELMAKLVSALSGFLAEQAQAGAAALQLFDSWAGALSETDYRRYVLPHNQRLVAAAQALGIPAIYFSTGTSAYLETLAETGAQVLSLDWRIDLATAWRRLERLPGPMPVLQGNLDPLLLLAPPEVLRHAVAVMLRQAAPHPGYIFNLGHGILPETPVDNVTALVEQIANTAG